MRRIPAIIFSILVLIAAPHVLKSQTKGRYVLSGQVTDSYDEPLAGASVYIRGHIKDGTSTDSNGYFSLEQYLPGKKIVTICSSRQDSINILDKENRGRADFIIVAPTDFPMSY